MTTMEIMRRRSSPTLIARIEPRTPASGRACFPRPRVANPASELDACACERDALARFRINPVPGAFRTPAARRTIPLSRCTLALGRCTRAACITLPSLMSVHGWLMHPAARASASALRGSELILRDGRSRLRDALPPAGTPRRRHGTVRHASAAICQLGVTRKSLCLSS
jgi:hypothetical protein